MNLFRKITFPLVPIYYLVTSLRNKLYDLGFKKSISYSFPVICIGNLSVGGTGKTPMVEYLINLLKEDFKLATLSRGYKRISKGFQLADENTTTEILGDEPFQFYNKFKDDIFVAVDADRNNGIKQLSCLNNPPKIVILDDAFQHRKVKAGFNILLTTYSNPYFNDVVLPTGNLRESRNGAKRADIIVVTKCPFDLSEKEKMAIIKQLKPQDYQCVFFSYIDYSDEIISLKNQIKLEKLKRFTLVTGIANSNTLVKFLEDKHLNFEHLNFEDHHNFTPNEIKELERKELIITTEKDFMRLKQYKSLSDALYYLPITIKIDNKKKFDSLIKDFVKWHYLINCVSFKISG